MGRRKYNVVSGRRRHCQPEIGRSMMRASVFRLAFLIFSSHVSLFELGLYFLFSRHFFEIK
jgi:hypothetical protein